MATSHYKVQIPFRVKGQTTCIHHIGGQLDLYCEECKVPVCIKCVTTVHKSHPMCEFSKITSHKKQNIIDFIEKTEKFELVQIQKYIASTDNQIKDNASNFDKISNKLKTQTNKLKEELSLYQQKEEDNNKLLQTYKQDLEIYSTHLQQQVQGCKIALQNNSFIQLYEIGCEIQAPISRPVKPTMRTVSLSPNQYPHGHLEQVCGQMTTSDQGQDQGLQGNCWSVRTSAGQKHNPANQRSKGEPAVSNPVCKTKVLEKWKYPCYITSVCPSTKSQVWTSQNDSANLTLLNKTGEVMDKVEHNAGITDICLSPTTNTLWICDLRKNILELVSGQLEPRFRTTKLPQCICITASNHVIVGMSEQISKFTTGGKSIRYTSLGETGKPLVCTPNRISECPVTQNIAVADWDSEDDDGDGKQHVVIMNSNFEKRFVYDGEVPDTYQASSQSGVKPFNPCIAVYDSIGNLIIGDCYNNNILLISGRGEFLRVIHTDDNWTRAFGIDREDVMWAVFGSGKLKLIHYDSV